MKTSKEISWKLEDIVAENNWQGLIQQIKKLVKKSTEWKKKISPTMEEAEFKKLISWLEELAIVQSRLGHYGFLWEAVDLTNAEAKLIKSQADKVGLEVSEILRPIIFWIKGKKVKGMEKLDRANANRLYKSMPKLEYWFEYAWKSRKHNLKIREEDIIANKDVNAISPLLELRQLITKDLDFEMVIKGKKKKIETVSELVSYTRSDNPKEREGAYVGLLDAYKKQSDKYFAIYQGVVKDWNYEAKIRKYSSAIGVRNFDNHIDDKTVESLLAACQEKQDIFWRYFRYKAKKLGSRKLRRYDIYAPIEVKEEKVDYEKAKKMVMEVFSETSDSFYKLAKKIFDEGHIDSHPKKNKRNGAFCSTVEPKISPYVMLNHTNGARDVETMAHELGHGIHSLLASKQHYWTQRSSLPLAETASTFSELLMFDKLLENARDEKVIQSLLANKMADAYATILRQNYFVIFEMNAHEAIGRGVTKEELSDIYMDTLRAQFGDEIVIDPLFRYEWAYVSHIFESPFYCYAYNFGELVSYYLYSQYKKDKRYIEEIEKILKAGGSRDPVEVLDSAGANINEKEFWLTSLSQVENWQDRLDSMDLR